MENIVITQSTTEFVIIINIIVILITNITVINCVNLLKHLLS